MSACTFFGHHDCPAEIKPKLRKAIIDLIEQQGVDCFYIGNHGAFDRMACSCLRELSQEYPQICYSVVLAYLPQKHDEFDKRDFSDTILPEGIETVPRRFAISWRNRWMLERSEYVVAYVTCDWGGAAQFAELAEKKGKKLIKLAKL